MRKVFRATENKTYWDERWSDVGADRREFENEDIYPVRYSNPAVDPGDRVLEAGCGPGRLYFHHAREGAETHGLEFSRAALDSIRQVDRQARIVQGSITDLPYPDEYFDAVLAFGLFHNIEAHGELKKAFEEAARVLKPGGSLVASVRSDSLENLLIEWIHRVRSDSSEFNEFHKRQFGLDDLERLAANGGLQVDRADFVRNVSFLWKFESLRHPDLRGDDFDESTARARGFELSGLGKKLDSFLRGSFPRVFSNLIVASLSKPR